MALISPATLDEYLELNARCDCRACREVREELLSLKEQAAQDGAMFIDAAALPEPSCRRFAPVSIR